ncbi:MAG: WG repeat-containing protein [Clostridia bacterium]
MKSKKGLIIFLIISLIIFIFICYNVFSKKDKYNINFEEINQRQYFLDFDEKYGVINKDGEEIIDTNFDMIQIPNPSKDIFVCMSNYNAETGSYETKIYNKNREELFTNYEKVEAISRQESLDNIPYEKSVLKYKENGKYGLINLSGKKITNPIYDDIQALEYKEGMLTVKQNDKFGIININGDEIIKVKYDGIQADQYSLNENHNKKAGFIVSIKTNDGYKFGYINYKGKTLLETEYNEIARINYINDDESVYLVAFKNGQAGLFKNKSKVLENEYEDIQFDNINNLLILQRNGKQGVSDLDGKKIIQLEYDNIIITGNSINAQKGDEVTVFNSEGEKLKNSNFISVLETDNKDYFITIDKNENYGVIDKDDNVIIDNKYTFIDYLFDNYFVAQNEQKIGIVDDKGKEVIKFDYDVLQKIEGTDLIQGIKNENIDLIDKNMKKILTMKNAQIDIKENYIKIYNSEDRKYLQYDGKEVSNINVIKEAKLFAKKSNNKWGFVDKNGNIKIQYTYDMVTELNEYGYAGIKLNGKWGVINSEGKIIQEPIYDLQELEPQFIGKYYKVDLGYGENFYTKVN